MCPTNNKQKTQDVRICLGRPSCVFDKIEHAIMYEVTSIETTCNETTKRIKKSQRLKTETPGNRTSDPGSLYRVRDGQALKVSHLLLILDSWGCFFLLQFVGGRDNRDNNPKTWKVPPSPKEHSHKIRFLVWLSRCLKITKNHNFRLATNNYTKEKTGQNKLYLWSFQKLNKTPPGT